MNIKRLFNSYFWSDLWYRIDCKLCPRNTWVADCIPNTYSDKVELIPNFLFAAIINYVEPGGEDCFGRIDWTTNKVHRKVAKQIRQIYKWAKYDRAVALEKLDKSYPKRPEGVEWLDWINDNIPYNIKYKDVIKWEKYIKDRDDKFLIEIVSLREHLWT